MRPVYDPDWVDACLVDAAWPPRGTRILEKSIGIDWGLKGQTAVVLTAMLEVPNADFVPQADPKQRFLTGQMPYTRMVGVLEAQFMTGKLTPEVIRVLYAWQEMYGSENFFVYGDASHPYQNQEVDNAGFDCRPVLFQKFKDYGIGNCTKFFTSQKRYGVRKSLTGLLEQIKRYRLNRVGKPVKDEDHGPDALLCAMLHFNYEDLFIMDEEIEGEPLDQTILVPMRVRPSFDGMVPANVQRPAGLPTPPRVVDPAYPKPKKSSDGQIVML